MKKNKKKFKIGLIGYGQWGKKVYRNLLKYKQFNIQIFSKNGKKPAKKISTLSYLIDFDLIYLATTEKINSKYSSYLINENINVISEKPVFMNIDKYKHLKKKKIKTLFKVNYIYAIYNKFIKINKIINKTKIKKIFLFFSSTTKNNKFQTCKQEWLPHIFSLVDYYNLLKIKKCIIRKKLKNYHLKIICKNNTQINCIYGNNFDKKIRYQKIYLHNKKIIKINDNQVIINNSIKKFKRTPLEVLFDETKKILSNKKNFNNDLQKTLIYNKYINQLKL